MSYTILASLVLCFCMGAFCMYNYMKKQEPAEYFSAANKYQNFQYLVENIRSCSKFSELITCTNWLEAIKPSLELHAHHMAVQELDKKERELLDKLNRSGMTARRVQ